AARFASMADLLAALRADPALVRQRWLRVVGAVVGAVAMVGAGAASSMAYKARRGAQEQARLARQLGGEVEKIAAIARFSALLPLNDRRPETAIIRDRMDRLRERMGTLGAIAAGPGHEALGRGFFSLEQYEDALRELEAAYATGYRSPELAYALGMVHGKLYQ